MHEDFQSHENIWQFELRFAIVVLIEMIVLKHVICPNNIENERLKVLFRKFIQPIPKTPLYQKPL